MIPTYEELMLPFLRYTSDGREHTITEITDYLANEFKLSDDELAELLPSGTQPVFRNRVAWAKTYLKKSGLLSSPKRGHFIITERGQNLLKENPKMINGSVLKRYPEFLEFQSIKKDKKIEKDIDGSENAKKSDKTPEEELEFAYQELKSKLGKELILL